MRRFARMMLVGVFYVGALCARAEVVTYPAASGETLSQEYKVEVEGCAAPVYNAAMHPAYRLRYHLNWDPTYSFASFDCSGRVTVKVTSAKPLAELSIRPVKPAIHCRIEGATATFTLEKPGQYIIERNGNGRKDPLLLFANPIETSRPRQGDPGVVYFGPGRHTAGIIKLTSNQTLYIDGGAVVTGAVHAHGDNIKIMGRGLLENKAPWRPGAPSVENAGSVYGGYMIRMDHCTRARIEGIVIRKNSRGWTIKTEGCDGVVMDNVKICGSANYNDDGVDPVNTRNMTIEKCLIRTFDDALAFKGMNVADGNCENITVSGCIIWSDRCCAMLFGDECRAPYMRNITVKSCYLPYISIEGTPKKFAMLHSGEEMMMENLRFENIVMVGEGQDKNLIEMICGYNRYSKSMTAGNIRNITFKNITLNGKPGPYTILIRGYDEAHTIDGVSFENFRINGALLSAKSPNVKIQKFARNIKFSR